jgi:outer membrane lipoprotein carrier protein
VTVSDPYSRPAKLASLFQIAFQPFPDGPARLEALRRQSFVMRSAASFVFALSAVAFAALGANPDPDPTLKAIENRYNHAQSLKLDFSESYVASRRPAQNESGVLYLRKPGRMRWEYASPAGKVVLADGKDTWLYTPEDHRAEKSSLKLSEDMRAPLAFLLGKLDFQKDFQSFASHPEGADSWIAALPKSQNLPYSQVEFLASPDGRIHKVRVTNQDQSKLEFSFSNEQLNAPVAASLFVFRPPVGVEIVEADH